MKTNRGRMKYSEIKTMGELEAARRDTKERIGRKELAVREVFLDVKESYTPSNLIFSGLRNLSTFLPVEKMLLLAVRVLKRRIFK